MRLITTLADIDVKNGYVVTRSEGLEKSLSLELLEKDGWSLDVGATPSQGLLGISKDILRNNRIEIDIGAGITTKKEGYLGAHIRF